MYVKRIEFDRNPEWMTLPRRRSPLLPVALLALLVAGLGLAMSCHVDPGLLQVASGVG